MDETVQQANKRQLPINKLFRSGIASGLANLDITSDRLEKMFDEAIAY